MTVALLVVAGACGALARYEVELAVRRRAVGSFPYGTLLINVSGSLVLGVLAGLAAHNGVSARVVTVAGTGLLGAYTTFSTFEMETDLLAEGGEFVKAALYVILSVALGFVAAFGGAYIARNL